MFLVATPHGIPLDGKPPFIETGDDFPHQFQSVFSQYMIMLFQFVKLQPVFFRYRAGNLQLFRRQLDSLFPVPYFHDILSVIYGKHIVLAGFFVGRIVPPHSLSFLKSYHVTSLFFLLNSVRNFRHDCRIHRTRARGKRVVLYLAKFPKGASFCSFFIHALMLPEIETAGEMFLQNADLCFSVQFHMITFF